MNGRRKRSGDRSRDGEGSKRPHYDGPPITHAIHVGSGEPIMIEDLD